MKQLLKKLFPERLYLWFHYLKALLAAAVYRWPSRRLYVIGITGTKGKTSAANFVWSVLNAAKLKTGLIGTANIRMGDKETMNEYHMTMPGPFVIQKILRTMVKEGCTHVVMEATSEGMKLSRHIGIDFDCAIFTNLTPEHLPSHGGSFDNYKQAKAKLFKSLKGHRKTIRGENIESGSITNFDDEHQRFYKQFPADRKITYGLQQGADLRATEIKENVTGVDFRIGTLNFHLNMLGKFNVLNALPAIAAGRLLGLPEDRIRQGIAALKLIPGRMEVIDAGQNFTTIVDYAHEKVSMNLLLDAGRGMATEGAKVIVLLGAEGGGRDKAKRSHMGEAAAKKADIVICSNVDPYEDDPTPIVEDIAIVAEQHGKKRGLDLFVIEDRREGIRKALSLAKPKDIVLITGKGAEQTMIIGGKSIPWDDREVVREELMKLTVNQN
ncbi:MAG: Mur ligase family protein [Candidatus Saccharibacteria bacterium]